jgi:hypothetical protein
VGGFAGREKAPKKTKKTISEKLFHVEQFSRFRGGTSAAVESLP